MSRSRVEVDNLRFRIERMFRVFGKSGLHDQVFIAWLSALDGYTEIEIVKAIDQYCRESDTFPKPKNILEIIKREKQRDGSFKKNEIKNEKIASPKIAKAWVIFISRALGFQPNDNNPDLKIEWSEAVEIVNREAARLGEPAAIPDEFKIPEIWENFEIRGETKGET